MASVELTWPIRDWPNPNRDRREHWAKNAKKARAIREAAGVQGAIEELLNRPLKSPVEVRMAWAFPDRRPRDLENWSSKALLDGLVDSGLIAGDDHAHIVKTERVLDPARSPKGHLRVTVTITERPPDSNGPQRAATRAGLTTQSET